MLGKDLKLTATFGESKLEMNQRNVMGDVVESLTFMQLKNNNVDLIRTPPYASPDFVSPSGDYGYEHKCFTKQPSFDIGNFESYVSQLCEHNGVRKKVLGTKYIVFEYSNDVVSTRLENFYMMNVWNLVGYDGKYPITMQVRRGNWCSIRPSAVSEWYKADKTPSRFMKSLLRCIEICPNGIKHRETKIRQIADQCSILNISVY
jgi:hypothetical protein